MATTINASASSGLITTADTSTILQLQTGGTTGLTVSAAQVVTLANPLPVASGGSGGTTSTGTGANVLGTTPSFTSTIGVGGATASASGAGITFPATQSASSDANTLDDYEEGTWTPTGNGITFASASGTYTKIGRVVTVTFNGRFPVTSNTSDARFGSLPFTVAGNGSAGSLGYVNTSLSNSILLNSDATSSHIGLFTLVGASITNANMSNAFFTASMTYFV